MPSQEISNRLCRAVSAGERIALLADELLESNSRYFGACYLDYLRHVERGGWHLIRQEIEYEDGEIRWIERRFVRLASPRFTKPDYVAAFVFHFLLSPRPDAREIWDLLVNRVCWLLPDMRKGVPKWQMPRTDPAVPLTQECELLTEGFQGAVTQFEAVRQLARGEPPTPLG